MADSTNKLTTRLLVAGGALLVGFLVYSNIMAQRRLAQVEEILRADKPAAVQEVMLRSIPSSPPPPPLKPVTPPRPGAPTPSPPPAPPPSPPRSPESIAFVARLRIDSAMFTKLRTFNDAWIEKLKAARSGQITFEELDTAYRERAMRIPTLYPTNPGLARSYEEFLAALPGPRIVVVAPGGQKYEGISFE